MSALPRVTGKALSSQLQTWILTRSDSESILHFIFTLPGGSGGISVTIFSELKDLSSLSGLQTRAAEYSPLPRPRIRGVALILPFLGNITRYGRWPKCHRYSPGASLNGTCSTPPTNIPLADYAGWGHFYRDLYAGQIQLGPRIPLTEVL